MPPCLYVSVIPLGVLTTKLKPGPMAATFTPTSLIAGFSYNQSLDFDHATALRVHGKVVDGSLFMLFVH